MALIIPLLAPAALSSSCSRTLTTFLSSAAPLPRARASRVSPLALSPIAAVSTSPLRLCWVSTPRCGVSQASGGNGGGSGKSKLTGKRKRTSKGDSEQKEKLIKDPNAPKGARRAYDFFWFL